MDSITVGDLVVQPIFDGTAVLHKDMWTGSNWAEHQHLLNDDGTMVVPVGAFLVRVGERMLLLDAGVGDVRNDMFDGGRLLQSLAAVGVQSDDIDCVMISHLHSDHMGWLESDGAATFSNATVHIGAADWAYFVEGEGGSKRRAERLRCIESHVDLIDHDGTTILPGVTTRATPGHTPGHTSTVISSGDQRLIVLGDALHCPAQLTESEWQFLYDVDVDLAVQSRQALLREAEVSGTTLLPCHFPGMQAARLLPAHGQRHWVLSGQ